jgi:hypothetical protein
VPVNRPQEVQVSTTTPLLRLVLVILLLLSALAGLMVTGGVRAGWLTLAVVVVAGPVIVLLDGRAKNRAEAAARPSPSRTLSRDLSFSRPRRAA